MTDPLAPLTSADSTDVSDPDAAAFVEAYAALEDFLAAHPDGLPPKLVAVYGQDVRECRRLWDAARTPDRLRTGLPHTCGGDGSRRGSGLPGRALAAEALDEAATDVAGVGAAYVLRAPIGQVAPPSRAGRDPRSCGHPGRPPEEEGVERAPPPSRSQAECGQRPTLGRLLDRGGDPAPSVRPSRQPRRPGKVGNVEVGRHGLQDQRRTGSFMSRRDEQPALVAPRPTCAARSGVASAAGRSSRPGPRPSGAAPTSCQRLRAT